MSPPGRLPTEHPPQPPLAFRGMRAGSLGIPITLAGEHKETWAQRGGLTHPQGARALGPEAWKASEGGDNLQGLALKDEPQVKWQLSIPAIQGITRIPQALRFWLSRPWEGPRLW